MTEAETRLARLAPMVDVAVLALAAWAAWMIRFQQPAMPERYLLAVVLAVLLGLVLLPALGAYRGRRWIRAPAGVRLALPALTAVFAALVMLAAMTRTTADFSRLWVGYWLLLSVAGMALWRAVLGAGLRHARGRTDRRVLVVGTGALAADTARRLIAEAGRADVLAGFVRIDGAPAADLPGPELGGLEDLLAMLADAQRAVSEVWLAAGDLASVDRERIIAELQMTSLPVRYVPDLSLLNLIGHRPQRVAGMTVIELNATPLDGPDALIKGALDRLLAALLLVLLSPLLLAVAGLIRLDSPGPVLFRQPRHGSDGRVFEVLKFRSMRASAVPGHTQATRDDPRVTRIGRWIRRTSIDELPQLLNVLAGDMSLVGPRPHPVALNDAYARRIESFMQRHRVKPGITGWAQINGYRGRTDTPEKMQKRVALDLYYIENWSLALDFRILLLTAFRGWRSENAY